MPLKQSEGCDLGHFLLHLLSSTIPLKRIKLSLNQSEECRRYGISSSSVLTTTTTTDKPCSLCSSAAGHVQPIASTEERVLREFVLKRTTPPPPPTSSFLEWKCSPCSKVIRRLVRLNAEIEAIATCIRTVIRLKGEGVVLQETDPLIPLPDQEEDGMEITDHEMDPLFKGEDDEITQPPPPPQSSQLPNPDPRLKETLRHHQSMSHKERSRKLASRPSHPKPKPKSISVETATQPKPSPEVKVETAPSPSPTLTPAMDEDEEYIFTAEREGQDEDDLEVKVEISADLEEGDPLGDDWFEDTNPRPRQLQSPTYPELDEGIVETESEQKQGSLPFCHLCQKSFSRPYVLRRHQKNIHKIQKPGKELIRGIEIGSSMNGQDTDDLTPMETAPPKRRSRIKAEARLSKMSDKSQDGNSEDEDAVDKESDFEPEDGMDVGVEMDFNPKPARVKRSKQFWSSLRLKKHKETRCVPCNQTFTQKISYEEHLKTMKHATVLGAEAVEALERNKIHPCNSCKRMFPTKSQLRTHALIHAGQFFCDKCGKHFNTQSNLDCHYLKHGDNYRKGLIPQEYKNHLCSECGKRFYSLTSLRRHVKHVHAGIKAKCGQCGSEFADSGSVYRHKLYGHCPMGGAKKKKPPHPKLSCEICSKSLTGSTALLKHIEIKHFADKTKCPYGCGQGFREGQEWIRHLEQCSLVKKTGQNICECFTCNESFPNHLIKIGHLLQKHDPFPCTVCSEVFSRNETLKIHLISHNKEARP